MIGVSDLEARVSKEKKIFIAFKAGKLEGPYVEVASSRQARIAAHELGVTFCGELIYEAAQDGTILRIGSGRRLMLVNEE